MNFLYSKSPKQLIMGLLSKNKNLQKLINYIQVFIKSWRLVSDATQFVKELGYDFPNFELDDFIDWVEDMDRTTIELVPLALPLSHYGAWSPNESENTQYIFYNKKLSKLAQIQTILHEIAHYLLGHEPTAYKVDEEIIQCLLLGGMEPTSFFLSRSARSDLQENEAESVGLAMLEHATKQGNTYLSHSTKHEKHAGYLRKLGLLT